MAKCHTCIKMLEQIVTLQTSNASLHDIKALWQEFYAFLEKNRSEVISELWGLDAIPYHYLLNRALSYPLYADGKEHRLDLSYDYIDYSKHSSFTKEERENFIKQAMASAVKQLETKHSISEGRSSLFQCCEFCSKEIASSLKAPGCNVSIINVNLIFSSSVPHTFCYAGFLGDDGSVHPYIIDMTYRQFYTLASTMKESRYLVVKDLFQKEGRKYFIAPGFFASMEAPEKMDTLLQKGYFNDLSSLEMYGNSFYQASLSRESDDLAVLKQQRRSGEEYFKSLIKMLRGKV